MRQLWAYQSNLSKPYSPKFLRYNQPLCQAPWHQGGRTHHSCQILPNWRKRSCRIYSIFYLLLSRPEMACLCGWRIWKDGMISLSRRSKIRGCNSWMAYNHDILATCVAELRAPDKGQARCYLTKDMYNHNNVRLSLAWRMCGCFDRCDTTRRAPGAGWRTI